MNGLFDAIVDLGNAGVRRQTARDQAQLAKEAELAERRRLQVQDRTPELVSDSVGTYQRSRSPIADAFLESMLSGQNPAAVQGTRAGAAGQRATAQRGFDQQTGGMDALRNRQRRAMAATPWLPPEQAPLASRLDEQRGDPRAKPAPVAPPRPSQYQRDKDAANSFLRGGR